MSKSDWSMARFMYFLQIIVRTHTFNEEASRDLGPPIHMRV